MKILLLLSYLSFFLINNTNAQGSEKERLVKLMLGKWYEAKDPNSRLQFTKTSVKEYYKGVKGVTVLSYVITNKCCDSTLKSTEGTGYYLKETDSKGITYCYNVTSVSEDSIELVYSGGRLIVLRRMKG